jgi:poly(hydroxyalkanoate) depolymerase family esterase
MTKALATAMRRALQRTCASDAASATAIIQDALRGAPLKPSAASLPGLSKLSRLPVSSGLVSRLPNRATPPVPTGARYETRAYGGRTCRVFVPSCDEDRRSGLVVMLHGCTQTPDDFALGTTMNLAAEYAGFVVVYPAQTPSENMQSCWNWFRPEDQRREGGEPAVLATIARQGSREFNISEGRIFAAGLSAGGAMAAILAGTHPDLFNAVCIHSGLPAGAAHDVPSAFAAMRKGAGGQKPGSKTAPMIVFHGTADFTVSPINAELLVQGNGTLTNEAGNGRRWSRLVSSAGSELWLIEGAGHAWFGGDPAGSYADPLGPNAASETLRFFQSK